MVENEIIVTQERLKRHIQKRMERLQKHEELRLGADREKDAGQTKKAKPLYEETARKAGVASSDTFARRTKQVIAGWVENNLITPQTADWLLDQFNLGYAGETRIETIASTNRLKLSPENEKQNWTDRAITASKKHIPWEDTLSRINQTLTGDPILWTTTITTDRAIIYQAVGDKQKASEMFSEAYSQAINIYKQTDNEQLKTAAASDGGICRVRQARLMEEERKEGKNVDKKQIMSIFKEGRNLVHQAEHKNLNFERSKVIELWYIQYLLDNKRYFDLLSSIPVVFWLFKNKVKI